MATTLPFLRRRRGKTWPPKGEFVLVYPADLPNSEITEHDFDGPYDGGRMVDEGDGRVTFFGEGLPYTVTVARTEGRTVFLKDGHGHEIPARVEPWPLASEAE